MQVPRNNRIEGKRRTDEGVSQSRYPAILGRCSPIFSPCLECDRLLVEHVP